MAGGGKGYVFGLHGEAKVSGECCGIRTGAFMQAGRLRCHGIGHSCNLIDICMAALAYFHCCTHKAIWNRFPRIAGVIPVVTQHIAGGEGRFIRRALGTQAADCAGLVVDRLFGTDCSRLQILRLCFFSREAVCCHLAVCAVADRADSLVRAVCCAAVAVSDFRMAGITLADSGVGLLIAVLHPLAPVVVKSGIRCGKRIGVVSAYFTARTGQVIHRVIGAVRRSFQRFGLLNLLCVGMHMNRRPVGVEGLRTEHCHGGVFLNLGAAALFRVPAGKIVSRIVGNRQRAVGFAGRQRFGFVRFVQCTAVGVKCHSEGPRNRAGNKVQLLVILILHMGIDVVCEEVIRVVVFVSIGKRHRIACIRSGDADGRPGGHADLDGQRLAGGQIHIVGFAGNRVVLHEGLVSDPQLAAVAGVDINAAAIVAGFVILDLTAIELADRAGTVNIYAAAVAGGRIAGNLAALHNQPRRLLIQIDGAAVAAGVSGDLAVMEVEHAVLVKHMNRAAFLHGPVVTDLAAPHVERRHLI